jgi:hypothetical protein
MSKHLTDCKKVNMINLQLEFPEKSTISFQDELPGELSKDLCSILKDDDSDLFYFNHQLGIIENGTSFSLSHL